MIRMFRITRWPKSVARTNFVESWTSSIAHGNFSKCCKRKITNRTSFSHDIALSSASHRLRQVADVEKRRAELLRAIKRKDRRTDHFVKDKEETVKLVGSLIPLRTSSPTLVASSLARWPNLRKTLERTDEETTKTSIRRPNEQN